MLIIGTDGTAKDLLMALPNVEIEQGIAFYDDQSDTGILSMPGQFRLIHTAKQAVEYMKQRDARFSLGILDPMHRQRMFEWLCTMGGTPTTVMSETAIIGNFDTHIGAGCTILPLSIVSNSSRIGKGCMLGFQAHISHDCMVGDFCQIAPGACMLGWSSVGDLTEIGANATILPSVRIGSNCKIAAGTVVTRDVPDGKMVAGVPGRIIGSNDGSSSHCLNA